MELAQSLKECHERAVTLRDRISAFSVDAGNYVLARQSSASTEQTSRDNQRMGALAVTLQSVNGSIDWIESQTAWLESLVESGSSVPEDVTRAVLANLRELEDGFQLVHGILREGMSVQEYVDAA